MPYQLNLATFAPLQHLYGVFEAHCHGTSFLQVRLVPSCLFFRLPFSQSVSRHPHARYITSLCGHPSLTQPPSPSLQGTLMRVTLRACVVILPINILLSLHSTSSLSGADPALCTEGSICRTLLDAFVYTRIDQRSWRPEYGCAAGERNHQAGHG